MSLTELVSLAITLITVISYIVSQFLTIKQLKVDLKEQKEEMKELKTIIPNLSNVSDVDTLETIFQKALKDQDGQLGSIIQQITSLVKKESIEELNTRLINLTEQRSKDVIIFTDVLGKFNVTLTRLDTTMGHFNTTLSEIKQTIRDHDKDLKILNGKLK